MRIIGPPSAPRDVVNANLLNLGPQPVFGHIAAALWPAAVDLHVDPVGAIAQAYKETGGGKFGRAVTPQHYNTCGLKIRHLRPDQPDNDPEAHAKFASWDVGALAHVQHVRVYAGWPIDSGLIVDPRYWLVLGQHRVENWSEFGGGKWAPSPTYGREVEDIMRRLQQR